MFHLFFKPFMLVTLGPRYFEVNVNQFVLIMCSILRKMQTGLLKLPDVLIPKSPKYFVNFTMIFLQCLMDNCYQRPCSKITFLTAQVDIVQELKVPNTV